MAKGISLHIGLNSVDPAHYDGWDGMLAACEFDAKDMVKLATKHGFEERTLLLTKEATTEEVIQAMQSAAKKLTKGDIFLLTYSGHGGQVPDSNFDEDDRKDETWVLFNRQLVDDELHGLYAGFKAGVRIMVLSDSCHSGTVTRAIPPWEMSDSTPRQAVRMMPQSVGKATYKKNKAMYDKIQKDHKDAESIVPKATILLISGCQDNQLSQDGEKNGLFTGTLKNVWRNGKFAYGYHRFCDSIVSKMPADQSPNYYVIGAPNAAFESQKPFTV